MPFLEEFLRDFFGGASIVYICMYLSVLFWHVTLATLLNTSNFYVNLQGPLQTKYYLSLVFFFFFMNVPQRNRITRGLLSTIVRIVIRIEKNIECSDGSAITKKTKLDFGFSNIHIFFIFYRIFFPYLIFFFWSHRACFVSSTSKNEENPGLTCHYPIFRLGYT